MSVFRDTARALAEQVHAHLASRLAKAETPADPFAEQQAETFLSGFDFAGLATLLDDFTEVLGDVALSGARQGMTTVRLLVREPTDFALPSDVVQTWASEHAAELVGKRVLEGGTVIDNPRPEYALDDATREMLRGTIRDAFTPDADGAYQTFAELRAALEGSYAFSEDRAAVIARNEVGRALIEGNLAAYRASDVPMRLQWILADTHPEPDECDDNDGAEVALGEPFPSGDLAPPLHVNCLCDVLGVVGEEE